MASPPQTYFFCTKQTKSLLDALQITRHLHFFEIKRVCQSNNAWGKYCYFVAKTFPRGAACVFESSFWGIFGPIWTRIPSNPLFFDHFGANWTHFRNLLESSAGAQYQHFHSNHQILMFLNIECRGGYWRNSTFCEKMKFLSKQYRLRKKKRTKNKKVFTPDKPS